MQDVSEAVSEAVGTVLSEQETIVAEVEAEASANAEAEETAPDTDDVVAESEEEVEVSEETEAEARDEEIEASETEDTETETEEPEVEAASEEYVNVPVLDDELATNFTLFDAEGELEIPDVIVEYKANGKVRKDRLDKVVKLAQQRFSPDPEAQ